MKDCMKLKHFLDWYKPGLPHKELIDNFEQTADPTWVDLVAEKQVAGEKIDPQLLKYAKRTMAEAGIGLFSASELWGRHHGMPIWMFWTQEYVDGLARLIVETYGADAKVVEVGCGDGALSMLLKERGINIIATDDCSWDFDPQKHKKEDRWFHVPVERYVEVEKVGYYEAIKKHRPDVILVSWMPYQEDWTPGFRRFKSTKGYIIIGEGQGGCTGGDRTYNEKKGWQLVSDNHDFDQYNLSRTDYLGEPKMMNYRHCSTFHFRRIK